MFSNCCITLRVLHTEGINSKRREIWTHRLAREFLGLALHDGRGAGLARARCTRGALRRRRALHLGAARPRARRALTCRLLALAAVQDDRRLLRNTRLQHILAQIGNRRALGLQHVLAHVGACRGRRDTGLEHILAQIRLAAWRADRARCRAAARRRLCAGGTRGRITVRETLGHTLTFSDKCSNQ